MGIVTCVVPVDLYFVNLLASLVIKRDFPMPERVELTTLTQELCVHCELLGVCECIRGRYLQIRCVHYTHSSQSTMEADISCVTLWL